MRGGPEACLFAAPRLIRKPGPSMASGRAFPEARLAPIGANASANSTRSKRAQDVGSVVRWETFFVDIPR